MSELTKEKRIAFDIKKRNQDEQITTPIADISDAVQELQKHGLAEEQLKRTVTEMFLSEYNKSFDNTRRTPSADEIAIYQLDGSMCDLVKNPR